MDVKPTSSDTRAPQIVRDRRSRPPSSVPSGVWRLKVAPGGPYRVSSGLGSGSNGASSASEMMSTSQPTANQKAKPSRCLLTTGTSSVPGTGSGGPSPCSSPRSAAGMTSWSVGTELTNSRVEQRIERVDDEVHDHVRERDDQDDALHHEVVLAEDGIDDGLADARDREDVLDDERAAEQGPGGQAKHRDEREARGAQRVPEEDAPRPQSFGLRGGDEVLLERVDHVGSQEARVGGRGRECERERGQEERIQLILE